MKAILKDMELTEKNLKQGTAFVYRTPPTMEDYRECTIEYFVSGSGANKFAIWFNGSLLHTSKTYRSAIKKLDEIKYRWELIFDRVEKPI